VKPVEEQGRRGERLPVMDGGHDEGRFSVCLCVCDATSSSVIH